MTDQAEGLREVIARAIYGWTENDWAAVAEQGGSTALEDAANVLTAVNEYVSAHLEDAIDAAAVAVSDAHDAGTLTGQFSHTMGVALTAGLARLGFGEQ